MVRCMIHQQEIKYVSYTYENRRSLKNKRITRKMERHRKNKRNKNGAWARPRAPPARRPRKANLGLIAGAEPQVRAYPLVSAVVPSCIRHSRTPQTKQTSRQSQWAPVELPLALAFFWRSSQAVRARLLPCPVLRALSPSTDQWAMGAWWRPPSVDLLWILLAARGKEGRRQGGRGADPEEGTKDSGKKESEALLVKPP